MVIDIFLVRHGAAQRDSGIAYHEPPGPPLTPQGVDEACQAAAFLAGKGLEHLFVSPFVRTSQTADQLAAHLMVPRTVTPLIEENRRDEPMEALRLRVRDFLSTLPLLPLRRVGLVTHGMPMRALLLELSQGQVDFSGYGDEWGNPAPTGGIWRALYTHPTWQIEFLFRPQLREPVRH